MQDASEKFLYPEVIADSLRLELSFTCPLEYLIELIVLRELLLSAAVDKFGVAGKTIENVKYFCPTIIRSYPPTQESVTWFIFL